MSTVDWKRLLTEYTPGFELCHQLGCAVFFCVDSANDRDIYQHGPNPEAVFLADWDRPFGTLKNDVSRWVDRCHAAAKLDGLALA